MSDELFRCTLCASEFTASALDALPPEKQGCCPACGTKSSPMRPADDVVVRINWHELRILCIWAERWASEIEREPTTGHSAPATLRAIARRLRDQHPSRVALTLAGEVADLQSKGHDVELRRGGQLVFGSPPKGAS